MISYKRDMLEKQSLSEEKMGRCSPIYERVHKKIVEYLKNNRNFRNSGCNTDLMRNLFLYFYINYTISKHLKTLSNEYVCNAWTTKSCACCAEQASALSDTWAQTSEHLESHAQHFSSLSLPLSLTAALAQHFQRLPFN